VPARAAAPATLVQSLSRAPSPSAP
jgi:hypothetical protein